MAISVISAVNVNSGTPTNSNKDGNFIRILVRDTTGSATLSPHSAVFVLSNASLQTRAPRGALRRIFRAFDDGLSAAVGITRLTALTKAQAREILDSRCASPATPSVLTTSRCPRARITVSPVANPAGGGVASNSVGMRVWSHDVSVDASGRPTILLQAWKFQTARAGSNSHTSAAAYAFLDIEYCHPITGR